MITVAYNVLRDRHDIIVNCLPYHHIGTIIQPRSVIGFGTKIWLRDENGKGTIECGSGMKLLWGWLGV